MQSRFIKSEQRTLPRLPPAATACVYVTQYVDNCNCRDVVTCKSEHILPKITLYFDTHCIDISVNRLSLKRAFGKLGKQKNV